MPFPSRFGAGLDGDPVGDLMQPAAEPVAAPDRPRLADQNQERGLKGVLGIVRIAEHSAAGTQHHRPVPLD